MERKEYNYDINGFLKINTNFPGYIPAYFSVPARPRDLDVIIRVEKGVDIVYARGYSQIAPGLFYNNDNNSVISVFRIFGITLAWRMKGLFDTTTEVFVNKAYKSLIRMPISTVHPLGDYIKFILQIKLILKGYSFILGGSIRPQNSDSASIITSCGGMGKTTTTLNLWKELGGNFLADDSVIISKEKVYPYPSDFRLRKFGTPLLSYNKNIPADKIILQDSILREGVRPGYIFFLEKSERNNVSIIDSALALNRALAINRKTIPYFSERSILAYFYHILSPTLNSIMEKENGILKELLSNLGCYIVSAKEPKYYVGLIKGVLKEK